jgi:hypothetical protein
MSGGKLLLLHSAGAVKKNRVVGLEQDMDVALSSSSLLTEEQNGAFSL